MDITHCLICKSPKIDIFWQDVWQNKEANVYRCSVCGIYFLWPQMSENETEAYYVSYAEHLYSRGVVPKEETPKQTFCRRKAQQVYRHRALRPLIKQDLCILEIGGGCGNFIGELCQGKDCASAYMVEACVEHLQFAKQYYKGLNCFTSLDELKHIDTAFDMIIMLHVFEHIRDPLEFLLQCSGLLNSNGQIILELPCSTDPLLSSYDCESYKNYYFQPMHPFVYCESALEYMFAEAGFQKNTIEYYQRYSLSNHLQWLSKGIPGGNSIFAQILGEVCEAEYKTSMQKNKTTDTIFAIFSKKNGHIAV